MEFCGVCPECGFIRVARVEEVATVISKTFRVEDPGLVLANWNKNVYCFHKHCPPQQNSLKGDKVWDGMLECPWHHFRYDPRTGGNLYPSNVYPGDDPRLLEQLHRLTSYPVQVLHGDIFIGLPEGLSEGDRGEPV